ncbi:MAG: hypothetical protein K8T91_08180 [Planctomycetes bacterium]|nr:hypothetical protein [Planctomycetota bacterium]
MSNISGWKTPSSTVRGFTASLLLVLALSSPETAGAAPKNKLVAPAAMVGLKVTIELQSGTTLNDAEVLAVVEGNPPGCISLVTIRDAESGKPRSLMAMDIASLTPGQGTMRYVFVKEKMRLWPDDPAECEKIRQGKGGGAAPPTPKKQDEPAATPEKGKSKKKDIDAVGKKGAGKGGKSSDGESDKLTANGKEVPLRKGVSYWPKLDEKTQAKSVEDHKAHLKEVQELFPNRHFTFVETDFFLFYSDLAPADLRLYVPYLDAMYRRLLTFFDIKQGTNIWRGKATVLIFANRESYVLYAQKFWNSKTKGVEGGRCFCQSNGEVHIGIHTTGADRKKIAAVIVHETTHGFVWRYKARCSISNWVDEGLAEHIASLIVPGSLNSKEQLAIQQMREYGTTGTGFYGKRLNAAQYGVAYCLTRYMISANAKRYRDFFEMLKAGATEEEALQEVYGIRRDVLIAQFGRSLRIPNLRPDLRPNEGPDPLEPAQR